MTAAAVLLGYAALLVFVAPRLLDRPCWSNAAPRLAMALWFGTAAAAVLAVLLAGLAVVVPIGVFAEHEGGVLELCVTALRERLGSVAGIAVVLAAAALVVAAVGRLAVAGFAVALATAAERARLHRRLGRARRSAALGAAIVDVPEPAAYCIPGRGGLIVLTAGALALLDRSEVEAVLAHERAHLAGRHHLLMAFAQVGRRAFGRLPLFARLPENIGRLVELAADDAAARRSSRLSLARSLLEFAAAQTPAPSLAASGGDTVARVERLLTPTGGAGRPGLGALLGGNAAFAAPFALLAAPVLTAATLACCQA